MKEQEICQKAIIPHYVLLAVSKINLLVIYGMRIALN
jgi:hypothetical protein